MSRAAHRCEICVRLGKKQCGYHRFKQEYLSKIRVHHQKQDVFAQTRSSLNRIQPSPIKVHPQHIFTPEKQKSQHIKIQYSRPQRPLSNQMDLRYVSAPQQNYYMPSFQNMQNSVVTHSRQIPVLSNNSSSRPMSNQILYYPIYPVYEVVYQPVSINTSYISTPSRVIYP